MGYLNPWYSLWIGWPEKSSPSLLLPSSSLHQPNPLQPLKKKKKIETSSWYPFHNEHLPKVEITCVCFHRLLEVSYSLKAEALFLLKLQHFPLDFPGAIQDQELDSLKTEFRGSNNSSLISRFADSEAESSRKRSLCFMTKQVKVWILALTPNPCMISDKCLSFWASLCGKWI